MLKHLQIKNYALIKELKMDPVGGLNTITGETGAGKSIMLGAIGLLLGNRADTKALLNPEEKCFVEGIFDIREYNLQEVFYNHDLDYFSDCIIRREISPSGKSRAFVNDTPVNLEVISEIGAYLIDIHSQSDTLLLGKANFQLRFIDAFADNFALLEEYKKVFTTYKKAAKKLEELNHQAVELKKEADYNRFLFEELDKAALVAGEQEELEEEQKILEHAEEIKRKLLENVELLSNHEFSVINSLQVVARNMASIAEFSEIFKSLSERVEGVQIELKDILHEFEGEEQRIEFDPERQTEVSERLSLIYRLQQKHNLASIDELLKIKDQIEEKLHVISNIDGEVTKAEKEQDELRSKVKEIADALSQRRREVLPSLKGKLEALLSDLGMPHAAVDFEIDKIPPVSHGQDDLKILFSANRGVKPEELKKVASGGEFSRLMFAMKNIIADKTSLPTIIFDEIDTGVSGEIALKMAALMKKMAVGHQVVAITHLPQIAAKGDGHFFVYKDNSEPLTVSRIRKLEKDERILEIAKMIGGDSPSQTNVASAREMLAL